MQFRVTRRDSCCSHGVSVSRAIIVGKIVSPFSEVSVLCGVKGGDS